MGTKPELLLMSHLAEQHRLEGDNRVLCTYRSFSGILVGILRLRGTCNVLELLPSPGFKVGAYI